MAGLATGFWESTDELASHQTAEKVFNPQMLETKAKELRRRWSEAVKRAMNWKV
jgi:glycerol kinase